MLSLPSDQLMSEAGERADTISLAKSWKVEPIPYEARLELRDQGFLRPEAVGSPPAPIEPEADLGPLASGTGDPSIVDPGALYDCGKVSPFNCYFEGLSETIDPKTGALIVRQKDLALPGRNGFDLVIERVYNSQQAAAGKPVVDVRAGFRRKALRDNAQPGSARTLPVPPAMYRGMGVHPRTLAQVSFRQGCADGRDEEDGLPVQRRQDVDPGGYDGTTRD